MQLNSLEILDISKNRLQTLPENINRLSSLKVLAVQKNRIEKLPMYLGDIGSLQVLKLDGNPLTFPPSEICTLRNDTPAPSNDNEKDALITTQVKRYLKQIQTRERLRIDSEGDSRYILSLIHNRYLADMSPVKVILRRLVHDGWYLDAFQ